MSGRYDQLTRPLQLIICNKLGGFDTYGQAYTNLQRIRRDRRAAKGGKRDKVESHIYLCDCCGKYRITARKPRKI